MVAEMQKKSPNQRAAELGVPFGVYFSAMSVAIIYSDQTSIVSILALAMLVGTPFVLYALLRKCYRDDNGFTEYSGLWMTGILICIYGALITGLVTFLVFHFLRPDYFYELLQQMIKIYNSSTEPDMVEMTKILKGIVANGNVPRPIEVVFTNFWLVSFAGSIMSAIVSFVVKKVPLRNENENEN